MSPQSGHAQSQHDALLACPVHHEPLTWQSDAFVCRICGPTGRRHGAVRSFIESADPFYEGKYDNRTKYIPKNDGFWATLPLAIVLQGYTRAVAKSLRAGSTVLELGCAGGIAWLGRRYSMVGLDIASGALPLAAEDYALLIQGDATNIPLREKSVDGVISSFFFEHFDDAGKAAILSECWRVLRPGGKIIFYYDIWSENKVISAYRRSRPDLYKREFLDGDCHIGYVTPPDNDKIFHEAGFQIERQTYHQRTPILDNSCWQKFSKWPGIMGAYAKVNKTLTSGLFRLPALTLIAVVDGTVGKFLPRSHARCVTTVARKTNG